jgi:hypothetical protein
MNRVNVEVEKGKFLELNEEQAIELATKMYFENKQVKINNKIFDVMNYGNYRVKAELI